MAQQVQGDVRPSPIAGQWYPGNARDLAATIDKFLAEAPETSIPGEIIGLVAPHAGYVYSGRIAAHAFRLVKGMAFERVVVISPMHQLSYAPILTTAHQHYWTPLGTIQVDHDLLTALNKNIRVTPLHQDAEHSLEIELPFLQRVLEGPFLLVPLMLREQSYEGIVKLGELLAESIRQSGSKTLLVASSDLSHHYPLLKAKELDQTMLNTIEAFDPQDVIDVEEQGRAFACGRAAIATVLITARALGANGVKVVGYGTSADATGDRSSVVGYGAAAIYKSL
ncbi:MAG: AmmeMemoRadiSam system protein B [Anaerolineae bacterium]|nr:AmmeMemoRadiSam system protein B [Anaerolineae bacterium]